MLMLISIIFAVFFMISGVTFIEYRTRKSNLLKPKNFTVKEKIQVPVVGTVILYDFNRDVNGKVKRDDILSTAFMLVLANKDNTEESYITQELNNSDGSLEFVFDRDSLSPSDRLKLMSVSTNVNFEELQLLNKDMTKKDIPNPVRNAFTLEVMAKIQSHVDELIDEVVGIYVERYVEFMNSAMDDSEDR